MSKHQITIAEILWIHSKTKEGLHPLKIKVTYNRVTRYYPIQIAAKNVYLSKTQWEKIQGKQVRGDNKEIKEAIEDAKSHARNIVASITSNRRPFTFGRFESEFILNTSSKGFIGFFEDYLSELLEEGRAGTYQTYHCALVAFKLFRKDRDLDPIDLTPAMLRDYETFLANDRLAYTKTGKKIVRRSGKTTISIYMRALRAVYNYVAGMLPFLKEHYPFTVHQSDRSKYRIKSGSGSKGDALTIKQLQELLSTKTMPSSPEWRAKNLWFFSFYCNGMNFNDLARLTYSNISKDSISYVRHKTRNTESNEELIQIPLNDSIREIIITLGNSNKTPDNYVFDFLEPNMTSMGQRNTINQKIKIVNKWLKRLCNANGLPEITTYWARHSYASLLKQSGHSLELIREMLGHSDLRTTESYLKRFDMEKKREANEVITSLIMKKVS